MNKFKLRFLNSYEELNFLGVLFIPVCVYFLLREMIYEPSYLIVFICLLLVLGSKGLYTVVDTLTYDFDWNGVRVRSFYGLFQTFFSFNDIISWNESAGLKIGDYNRRIEFDLIIIHTSKGCISIDLTRYKNSELIKDYLEEYIPKKRDIWLVDEKNKPFRTNIAFLIFKILSSVFLILTIFSIYLLILKGFSTELKNFEGYIKKAHFDKEEAGMTIELEEYPGIFFYTNNDLGSRYLRKFINAKWDSTKVNTVEVYQKIKLGIYKRDYDWAIDNGIINKLPTKMISRTMEYRLQEFEMNDKRIDLNRKERPWKPNFNY